MAFIASVIEALQRWSQRIGPYLLIEILLPGGTLLALSLFLYRRWRHSTAPTLAIDRAERAAQRRRVAGPPSVKCRVCSHVLNACHAVLNTRSADSLAR